MIEISEIVVRDEWNALALSFGADVRQSWEWGQVRAQQGWEVVRFAAFAAGLCVGALAVLARRVPLLGVVGYAPRAPLLALDDERGWSALPQLLRAARSATGAAFIRLSPAVADGRFDVAGRLRAAGLARLEDFWTLWNSPRNVMSLSLEGGERDLLLRMARKRRQHISTARKKGVTAQRDEGDDALGRFHAMLTEHAARNHYPVRDLRYFESLRAAFAPSGSFALVEGRVNGEVASAQVGLRFGATAYALSAPSAPVARGTAVGELVHWEWLRWAHASGCRTADFGSSGIRVAPAGGGAGGGIYRFKVELGCVPQLWLAYHDAVFDRRRYWIARVLEAAAASRARLLLDHLPAGLALRLARRVA
jgi:lipid II:glycine glycyltransferase (peptidoglycan interpeptide bridge formation enzyme)